MDLTLNAVYLKVPEGYIGFVEELPGANTQGAILEEVRENLREAVELIIETNRMLVAEAVAGEQVIKEQLGHREINDFLARKICRDLQVPEPAGKK